MAQSFDTSLPYILQQYATALDIAVTKTTLVETLQSNPYYPSLYSISDTFTKFNIENAGFKIDEPEFEKLLPPFLAYYHLGDGNKDFVLVKKITNTAISFLDGSKKEKTVGKSDFFSKWQHIVFLSNKSEKSGETDFSENLKKEKTASTKKYVLYAIACGILLAIILLFFTGVKQVFPASVLLFTKLSGLAISILLLWYDIDKSNTIVRNICTGGKQLNCDAVINSSASKIFGISWSEIGFFYFAASFLYLVFPGIAFADKLPLISIISTVASGYILFSIYYQWRVVKQWCPLCLAVQVILLIELGCALGYYWVNSPLNNNVAFNFSAIFISGCLPIVLWYSLKPLLNRYKEADSYQYAYKRIMYNPEIFNTILNQQPAAPEGWQQLGIDIGNPTATNTIIKVCNPYCGPCAKVHQVLEDIINRNDDIKLKIIFDTRRYYKDAVIVVSHFLALREKYSIQSLNRALDDWYLVKEKNYSVFSAKHPVKNMSNNYSNEIDKMSYWCVEAEITGTPTLYINGKLLPETYKTNELENIL